MTDDTTLGGEFARAIADKDTRRMLDLLAADIDFRAMTPSRTWEAANPEEVVAIIFGHWFEDTDVIDSLEAVQADSFADRERAGYRLSVSNPEGRFLVEQQAYISERNGQIAWLRVLCSGYRPAQATGS